MHMHGNICCGASLTWDVGNYPVEPLRHDRVVRARSIRIYHDQRVQVTRLPTEGHGWGMSCLSQHETSLSSAQAPSMSCFIIVKHSTFRTMLGLRHASLTSAFVSSAPSTTGCPWP